MVLDELFSLAGRRALVTGAGRGLGRAVARGLAQCGADVALTARSEGQLREVAAEVESAGRRALVLPADLRSAAAVRELFRGLREAWGGLEILVNNAGTNIRKSLEDTSDDDWSEVLRTNLDGAFYCAREAVRLMEGGGSRIINIGSVGGEVAIPTGVAYAASKGALSQMTRSLAQELAPRDITVNCIAPWYFRTPLTRELLDDPTYLARVLRETPLGRIGEERDLIGVAVFLASAASSYVTGQTIAVDGGMTTSRFARPDC